MILRSVIGKSVSRLSTYLAREILATVYKFYRPRRRSNRALHRKFGFQSASELATKVLEDVRLEFLPLTEPVLRKYRHDYPEQADQLVQLAESYLSEGIVIHGFRYAERDKVLWQREPKVKKDVVIKYWRNYRFSTQDEFEADSIDPILIFKLHTHQHLIRYCQAYLLTGKQKYVDRCVSELRDWIDTFPVGFGYPFLISLNVSQRLITWCFVFLMLRDNSRFQDDALPELLDSIDQQVKFLVNNLSVHGQTNNFLLSELVCLVLIQKVFPVISRRVLGERDLYQQLIAELKKQVCSDGTSFENSTGYQKFVAELLVIVCAFQDSSSAYVEPCREYLSGLVMSLAELGGGSGVMPQIGDVSLERAYWFEAEEDVLNISDLTATAATLLDSEDLRYFAQEPSHSLFWMLGRDGRTDLKKLAARKPKELIRLFPDGGLGVLRSSSDLLHCMLASFDCGDIGLNLQGGHGHNDFGSFSLSMDKAQFIIDRGTYTYFSSSRRRNEYRSSKSHNMPIINFEESAPLGKGLFSIECGIRPRIMVGNDDKSSVAVTLSHSGYERLNESFTCQRTLSFSSADELMVKDVVGGTEERTVSWTFFLHPDIRVTRRSDKEFILQHPSSAALLFAASTSLPADFALEVATCSLSYGHEIETTKLCLRITSPLQIEAQFRLARCEEAGALYAKTDAQHPASKTLTGGIRL